MELVFQLTPPIQRATSSDKLLGKLRLFQLTPPIQRATNPVSNNTQWRTISTHAPYTEGDQALLQTQITYKYFNSRPLYRGRL